MRATVDGGGVLVVEVVLAVDGTGVAGIVDVVLGSVRVCPVDVSGIPVVVVVVTEDVVEKVVGTLVVPTAGPRVPVPSSIGTIDDVLTGTAGRLVVVTRRFLLVTRRRVVVVVVLVDVLEIEAPAVGLAVVRIRVAHTTVGRNGVMVDDAVSGAVVIDVDMIRVVAGAPVTIGTAVEASIVVSPTEIVETEVDWDVEVVAERESSAAPDIVGVVAIVKLVVVGSFDGTIAGNDEADAVLTPAPVVESESESPDVDSAFAAVPLSSGELNVPVGMVEG